MLRAFLSLCVVAISIADTQEPVEFEDIPATLKEALFAPQLLTYISNLTETEKGVLKSVSLFATLANLETLIPALVTNYGTLHNKTKDLQTNLNTEISKIKESKPFFEKVYAKSCEIYMDYLLNKTTTIGKIRGHVIKLLPSYKALTPINRTDLELGFPKMKQQFEALLTKSLNPFTIPEEYKVNFNANVTAFLGKMNLTVADLHILNELRERNTEFANKTEYLEAMKEKSVPLRDLISNHMEFKDMFEALQPETKVFMNKVFDGRHKLYKLTVTQGAPDMDEVDDAVEKLIDDFETLDDQTKLELKEKFSEIEFYFTHPKKINMST